MTDPFFKDHGVGINMPGKSGGKPKKLIATGHLPTFGFGREMPNSVTPGDTSMRHAQRYGKRDKAPDAWSMGGMLGDKL